MISNGQNSLNSPNPQLNIEKDYLYHFGLATGKNFSQRFQDVKFVCLGGKRSRMKHFAQFMYDKLGHPTNCEFEDSSKPSGDSLKNISESADRYAMYKVGPVLSVSHGIGAPSVSIVLHEILKLTVYAGCKDVFFFRIGTSGGIGVSPGTVIITSQAFNGLLEPYFLQQICGKTFKHDTSVDSNLAAKLFECAKEINVDAIRGNTLTANGFYEEQARLDGAVCNFSEEEKMKFLQKAHDEHEIRNLEMEAACCIATCNRANVKCAVVCVTLVNRLLGDQVPDDVALIKKWETYPQEIVAKYIVSHNGIF